MKMKRMVMVLVASTLGAAPGALAQGGGSTARGDSVGTVVSPGAPERSDRNVGNVLMEIQRTQSECAKKASPIERAECFRRVKDLHGEAAKEYDRLAGRFDQSVQGLKDVRVLTEQSLEPNKKARQELITEMTSGATQVADARGDAESARASADPNSPEDEAITARLYNDFADLEQDQKVMQRNVDSVTGQTRISEAELKIMDRRISRAISKSRLYRSMGVAARVQEKTWEAQARCAELELPTFNLDVGLIPDRQVPTVPMSEERRRQYEAWRGKSSTPSDSKVSQK